MSTGPRSSHKIETRRRVRSAKTGVKEKTKESGKPVLTPDAPTTRESARDQLLRTIKRYRPDVLVSLAANVLPLYSKFYRPDVQQHHLLQWWQLRDKNDKKWNRQRAASDGGIMPLFQLERALLHWADSYNLKKEWFLDYALQTLSLWCRLGRSKDLDWAYSLQVPRYVAVDVPSKFRFEYDPWDPTVDTWRSHRKKVTQAFEVARDAYRDTITATLQSGKRSVAREKLEEAHFRWIIDYQIPANGMTKTRREIARGATTSGGVDLATVNEAIKTLASLVDWELPPWKRGRPRKPKPGSDP